VSWGRDLTLLAFGERTGALRDGSELDYVLAGAELVALIRERRVDLRDTGVIAEPRECLYVGDGGGSELTGASACGMRAFMLRADDWADNDAHAREDDWGGPFLGSLTDVLALPQVSPLTRT